MKAIRFHSKVHRIAGIGVAALTAFVAAMAVIWTIANTSAAAASEKEVARILTLLSPSDPQTHLAAAKLHEKAYDPGDMEIALSEYEKAAGRSPNNYIHWLLLGSARTRAGESASAERAFRRALDLAPHYSRVHWALGNLLLREGQDVEAYDRIRSAVIADPSLSGQAASIALQMSGDDLGPVRQNLSGLSEAEVRLAILLVDQKRFDHVATVWRSVAIMRESSRFEEAAKTLAQKLFEAKQFRLASEVAGSYGDPTLRPQMNVITNSGFEMAVRSQNAGLFEWRVPAAGNPQYAITNAQKKSGQFSLVAIFNSPDQTNFQGISQIVAVEPGANYSLEFAYRADVKTKSEFKWEIASLGDGKAIASSDVLKLSTDWTTLQIDVSVPATAEGLDIRLVRSACSGAGCAASGSIWFDDLVLSTR